MLHAHAFTFRFGFIFVGERLIASFFRVGLVGFRFAYGRFCVFHGEIVLDADRVSPFLLLRVFILQRKNSLD